MDKRPNISSSAFWDIDVNKLDYINHKDYIILKIFNYGEWDDILNIIKYYGKNSVIESLIHAENITERGFHLASRIFKINKSEFKCSTKKQYPPSSVRL